MNYNKKKATIQDVAKLAGVSITTVSRVINDNYPVKEATKDKVKQAIEELNYNPNLLARALIQEKTQTIGIIVPTIENLFFSEVIHAIDETVSSEGYDIFLCNTKGEAANERRMIESLLTRSVDGIILIDPRTENIKNGYYEGLSKKIPTVLINGYHKQIECNFVLNEERSGMEEAMAYLSELGHRHIALLRGRTSYSYDLKEASYIDEIRKLTGNEEAINLIKIESGNEMETVNQSSSAVQDYLVKYREITAIIACNEWMAVGAIQGARNLNLNVPNDLSVIGFDNTLISQIATPKITTIDHNMKRLGNISAKRILEILKENEITNQKIMIETRLIKRESCKEVN